MEIKINIPTAANELIHTLQNNGHSAYVVGGCVRDSILGREPNDWDICTSATPDEMLEIFKDKKIIETGLQHGTVTVVVNGEPFEITTFRIDGEYSDNHPIAGIRYNGIAACMLTWCWFNTMSDNETGEVLEFEETMTKDAPMFTKYISDFDVWKFEYGDDTKAFEMGLQLYDLDPTTRIWDSFMYSYKIDEIISEGQILIEYRDNWAKEYCEHTGFEVKFEGYKCFAMNLAMISSDYFKSINQDDYDMFIGFSYNGKAWNYSLRSTKVDCSQIAMKYGGGGHKGAAGFSTEKLILNT